MQSEITCIICPIGCKVTVHRKGGVISKIEGYQCKKAIEYAKEEMLDPKRILTTTMIIKDGELPLVSVKTDRPVSKGKLFDIMDTISGLHTKAPVKIGDVLIRNIDGLEANIVATKNVHRIKKE